MMTPTEGQMKQLDDESVAKALGWKHKYPNMGRGGWTMPGFAGLVVLPPFTTSLDAIMPQVESRALWSEVHGSKAYKLPGENYEATVTKLQWDGANDGDDESCSGDTPALALCAALLQFLKENPDAR